GWLPKHQSAGLLSFSSVVFFHSRPRGPQIAGKSATQENIEVLVAARVGMLDMTSDFDTLEMFAVTAAIAPENNHDAAVVIARAPEPVALMITDRFRQTESRPEEIDRTSLTITIGENRDARLVLRRKRFVNARRCFCHIAPAEFIGEMLWQWPGWLILSFRRFDPEFSLIGNKIFRRQDRRNRRGENDCRSNKQQQVNNASPFESRARDFFETDRAGSEEHRIDRSEIIILAAQCDESHEQGEINDSKNPVSPVQEKAKPPRRAIAETKPDLRSGFDRQRMWLARV